MTDQFVELTESDLMGVDGGGIIAQLFGSAFALAVLVPAASIATIIQHGVQAKIQLDQMLGYLPLDAGLVWA